MKNIINNMLKGYNLMKIFFNIYIIVLIVVLLLIHNILNTDNKQIINEVNKQKITDQNKLDISNKNLKIFVCCSTETIMIFADAEMNMVNFEQVENIQLRDLLIKECMQFLEKINKEGL